MHAAIVVALCATNAWKARQRRRVPELVARARRRADEYARARADYDRLLRHRIANPLAAVRGIAITLESYPDLDPDTRRQLVSALVVASEELSAVSTSPIAAGPEEHELRAEPIEVDEPCGVRRLSSIDAPVGA